ncbi:MAG: hypothetical protein V4662_13720 [Verrucomicrobiota bacterium]
MNSLTPQHLSPLFKAALQGAEVMPTLERADVLDGISSVAGRIGMKAVSDTAHDAAEALRNSEMLQASLKQALNPQDA